MHAPMVKSEIFHVKLLQEAISRSASELPMRLTKSTQLTNQLAELILNDVVNEVVQETESSLGSYVDRLYDAELNGVGVLNPVSVLSNTLNSSMNATSTIGDEFNISEAPHSSTLQSSKLIPNNS